MVAMVVVVVGLVEGMVVVVVGMVEMVMMIAAATVAVLAVGVWRQLRRRATRIEID